MYKKISSYYYMTEKGNIEIIKNSLDLYSYNGKVYKTEAAMKKAKTMDTKRAIKQVKKEAYAVSEKKQNGKLQLIIKRIVKQN